MAETCHASEQVQSSSNELSRRNYLDAKTGASVRCSQTVLGVGPTKSFMSTMAASSTATPILTVRSVVGLHCRRRYRVSLLRIAGPSRVDRPLSV